MFNTDKNTTLWLKIKKTKRQNNNCKTQHRKVGWPTPTNPTKISAKSWMANTNPTKTSASSEFKNSGSVSISAPHVAPWDSVLLD